MAQLEERRAGQVLVHLDVRAARDIRHLPGHERPHVVPGPAVGRLQQRALRSALERMPAKERIVRVPLPPAIRIPVADLAAILVRPDLPLHGKGVRPLLQVVIDGERQVVDVAPAAVVVDHRRDAVLVHETAAAVHPAGAQSRHGVPAPVHHVDARDVGIAAREDEMQVVAPLPVDGAVGIAGANLAFRADQVIRGPRAVRNQLVAERAVHLDFVDLLRLNTIWGIRHTLFHPLRRGPSFTRASLAVRSGRAPRALHQRPAKCMPLRAEGNCEAAGGLVSHRQDTSDLLTVARS